MRHIAELAQQRDQVDAKLAESVRAARAAHRSWSEIGAMLGVSKQAAQRRVRNEGTSLTVRARRCHRPGGLGQAV
ncbi:MAG: hypothetical protein M5U19_13255 [Microthrixaceae bacterium]|nr:hypothetical protein [Microthrixaceae bacterium]